MADKNTNQDIFNARETIRQMKEHKGNTAVLLLWAVIATSAVWIALKFLLCLFDGLAPQCGLVIIASLGLVKMIAVGYGAGFATKIPFISRSTAWSWYLCLMGAVVGSLFAASRYGGDYAGWIFLSAFIIGIAVFLVALIRNVDEHFSITAAGLVMAVQAGMLATILGP